jgi:hypothetical protein
VFLKKVIKEKLSLFLNKNVIPKRMANAIKAQVSLGSACLTMIAIGR